MTRFGLSELQAEAILDLRLARLAALERQKIEDEYLAIIQLIAELEDILANPARVLAIIKDELAELKRKYAGERRTRVVDDSNREMTDEDLIADEDVVVTISRRGYIKRQPVATYRRQHRGGKGIIGHVTREEDAVEHLLAANTHDWALFFTNRGRVFSAKVHAIPDASRQAKGMAIINLPGVQVESGEVPVATICLPNFEPGHYLVLATRRGIIKKTPLEQFERVRSTGIRAITIADNDELAWVSVSSGEDDVIIATAQGMLARFSEGEVRPMGRDAAGVIGIRLARQGDAVVSMTVVEPESDLLVLSETGYGKRVPLTRVPAQAPRRPGRAADRARGSQDRPRRGGPAGHPGGRGAAAHLVRRPGDPHRDQLHQPLLGRCARRDRHASRRRRHGRRHRGVPAGLADRGAIGDNDDPQPTGGGPAETGPGRSS